MVIVPIRGDVVLGFLLDDELIYLTDKPAARA